ncbi:sugar hydrolase [Terribacillus sp. 179-K 1B1 HS]|uniref:alpha-L-rhamnosidase-related protein n=1 Tax=Terribacillus sp. 179-K 1B1 HS TaxID=3142388 RepID=UPI00399F3E1C
MHVQQNLEMNFIENTRFKKIAQRLKPSLHKQYREPENLITTSADPDSIHGWECSVQAPASTLSKHTYGKGDSFILDFGTHHVGFVSFRLVPVGSPPDAPAHVRLTFGEMPVEVSEPFASYEGWLSSSWLQEETMVVDVLPQTIKLSRRYSFRYVKVEVLDTSVKYKVAFHDFQCETVTSATFDFADYKAFDDPVLDRIDRVGIKTLIQCMQDVFEDGPKRDRRMWLGDLRLQALVNYSTMQQNDLVKRCLYLFAAVPNEQGQVAANLFIEPDLIPDDTFFYDYSLFFTTSLADYYAATKDFETLQELWPTALRQVEIALENLDESYLLKDEEKWTSFIDWNEQLNKQAPTHGVLIYSLKRTLEIAEILGFKDVQTKLEDAIQQLSEAAILNLWDEGTGFFTSGKDKQISWASQVWMVIAGVFDTAKNQILMKNVLEKSPSIRMNTPYMYHHLVEALIASDMQEEAIETIKSYWGKMVERGADTYWELYNPDNEELSPYGSHLILSYCHAWSCTPSYLLRKIKEEK